MPTHSVLNALLAEWRSSYPARNFPDFDSHVQLPPHTLVFLESPGPEVANSGVVSTSNQDGTAAELRRLISLAFDSDAETGILCWNAVPWFLDRPPRLSDVSEAKPLHAQLLEVLRPKLRCVLLLGVKARALLPFLSPLVGAAHIYGGHHPGRQAQIQNGLVFENEAMFSSLRERFAEKL